MFTILHRGVQLQSNSRWSLQDNQDPVTYLKNEIAYIREKMATNEIYFGILRMVVNLFWELWPLRSHTSY